MPFVVLEQICPCPLVSTQNVSSEIVCFLPVLSYLSDPVFDDSDNERSIFSPVFVGKLRQVGNDGL